MRLLSQEFIDWHKKENVQYFYCDTKEEVMKFLEGSQIVGCDTETTGLSPLDNELVLVQFARAIGQSIVVPFSCMTVEDWSEIFSGRTGIKEFWFYNAKFDAGFLSTKGVEVEYTLFREMMIYSYLYDSNRKDMSLKKVAKDILNIDVIELYEMLSPDGKRRKKLDVSREFLLTNEKFLVYSAMDPDLVLRLLNNPDMHQFCRTGQKFIYELETAVLPVIYAMESVDLREIIDVDYLKKAKEEVVVKIQQLEKEVYKLAGTAFNINSSAQLLTVFKKLGIKTGRVTDTGRESTGVKALNDISGKHPIIQRVLEYRKLGKLLTTYIARMLEVENYTRASSQWKQFGAPTGRMACGGDPTGFYLGVNFQSIPSDGKIKTREIKANRLLAYDRPMDEWWLEVGRMS